MPLRRQRAEQQRPHCGAAIARHQTDVDVRVDDDGPLTHHDQIAQQRHRRTEAGRRTVERTHHRDLDVEQVPDHLLGHPTELVERLERPQLREPLEVATGAERPLLTTRQDDHPGLAFTLEQCEQLGELVVQQLVDRVHR